MKFLIFQAENLQTVPPTQMPPEDFKNFGFELIGQPAVEIKLVEKLIKLNDC